MVSRGCGEVGVVFLEESYYPFEKFEVALGSSGSLVLKNVDE
jgi:hypothetical protein